MCVFVCVFYIFGVAAEKVTPLLPNTVSLRGRQVSKLGPLGTDKYVFLNETNIKSLLSIMTRGGGAKDGRL